MRKKKGKKRKKYTRRTPVEFLILSSTDSKRDLHSLKFPSCLSITFVQGVRATMFRFTI